MFKFKITLHEFHDKLDAKFDVKLRLSDKVPFAFLSDKFDVIWFTINDAVEVSFCRDSKKPLYPSTFHPKAENTDKFKDLKAKTEVHGLIIQNKEGLPGIDPHAMQVKATLEIIPFFLKKNETSVENKNIDAQVSETNMKIKLSRGFKR